MGPLRLADDGIIAWALWWNTGFFGRWHYLEDGWGVVGGGGAETDGLGASGRMERFVPPLLLSLLCLQPISPTSTFSISSRSAGSRPPSHPHQLSQCERAILSCCASSQSTFVRSARCFELNSCPGLNFVPNPCLLFPRLLLMLSFDIWFRIFALMWDIKYEIYIKVYRILLKVATKNFDFRQLFGFTSEIVFVRILVIPGNHYKSWGII